jgi:hypothetical protein
MRAQVREFVLKYFMRISDYRAPQQVAESNNPKLPKALRLFSNCPRDEYKAEGFGYSQRYCQLSEGGDEYRFPIPDPQNENKIVTQDAIIDLRELRGYKNENETFGKNYDWIIVKNPITDFGITVAPLGVNGPQLRLPIPAANFRILSKDTITCEEYEVGEREDGVIGRYGVGYAFVKDVGQPGIFDYGPGQLEPALQLLIWEVKNTGEVTVRMTFVSRAPDGIFNLSVNPLHWGYKFAEIFSLGAATPFIAPFKNVTDRLPYAEATINPVYPPIRWINRLTGNALSKYFCISERQINKDLIYIHFLEHYHAVMGSAQTWRQFPDWTDERSLPEWVRTGVSV